MKYYVVSYIASFKFLNKWENTKYNDELVYLKSGFSDLPRLLKYLNGGAKIQIKRSREITKEEYYKLKEELKGSDKDENKKR